MKALQSKVAAFLAERNWGDSPPGDFAKSISIEAAELLEHFQWSNPSAKEITIDLQKLEQITKEMADIAIYAIELAIILGVDFEKVITNKLSDVEKKYPVEKVRGKNGNVLKIKQEYRRQGKS